LVKHAQLEMRRGGTRIGVQRLFKHFHRAGVVAFLQAVFAREKIRIFLLVALCRRAKTAAGQEKAQQQRHGSETNRTATAAQRWQRSAPARVVRRKGAASARRRRERIARPWRAFGARQKKRAR